MSSKTFFNTLLAAAAATLIMATPAQATLQARDLSGDAVTDAFYDTDLNITWLRNAHVNGAMTWTAAVAWANGYSIGSYSDWRLPTSNNCSGFNCTGSEMGHLWYTELGNTPGSMTNTGDFQNLQSYVYWSGTEYAPDADDAWDFRTDDGIQDANLKNFQLYAMAVRPGDVLVAQVPEPESLLLALTGLSALVLVRRRRAVGASAL